jgi:RHS repeat-associated protein
MQAKSHTTTWDYDPYGRVTNKLDQTSTEILRYAYDPDNRLTNRWSAAKGNTGYAYDPVGNLTNLAYPSSGTVKFAYDAMNRRTNMVDSIGTTRYAYDAAGQLLTEDGPFTSDTVTNTYSYRRRVALSLQQPTGLWTNGFGWDLAGRLTNVTSQAGAFAYTYTALYSGYSGRLVQGLGLPGGANITNFYDPVARLLGTVLNNSGGSTLDSALYGYANNSQRTAYTNAAGACVLYSYDPIGQLTVAASSSSSEDRGYAYDPAWNLNWLTNGGTTTWAYDVDAKNQLTNGTAVGPLGYDTNGNLISRTNLALTYVYDDENRLHEILYFVAGGGPGSRSGVPPPHGPPPGTGWGTVFYYDGLSRLRQRTDMTYDSLGWDPTNEVDYIYDGRRVIQERNVLGTGLPTVSYTRGLDLSGSLEGAGGIGGLLARSSGYSSGNWTSHAYYHADGNGNITCLIDTNQSVVASYRYDPYGNTLSQSGSLADDNTYRFSSKEIHTNSLMYYYGYRFYDPSLQRWINRDPLGEVAVVRSATLASQLGRPLRNINARLIIPLDTWIGPNLYYFNGNNPSYAVDPLGLWTFQIGLAVNVQLGFINVNWSGGFIVDGHGNFGTYDTFGGGGGFGADIGGGLSFLGSSGNCVKDVAGPFGNVSASGGDVFGGALEGFSGQGSQGQTVTGGGFSIGVGAGGDYSVGGSQTYVHAW